MADSNHLGVSLVSFKAGGTIEKDRAVKLDSTEGQVIATTAITDVVIGFATHSASSGDTVAIQTFGKAKATVSDAVSLGAQLMPTASGAGKVVTAAGATAKSCAVALQASTADAQVIEVFITGMRLNGIANS